jgi:excisionase family DNA binding protein
MQAQTDSLPAILTVEEAARFLRIGRSAAYEGVRTGAIPSVRVGKLYRIPRGMLMQWLGQSETAGYLSKGQPAVYTNEEGTGERTTS